MERNPSIERVRAIARLLDTRFEIPALGVRFGIDAIIGLIPGIGDVIGVLLSSLILIEAIRIQAPGVVIVRMLSNLFIDGALGVVPVAGDIADVYFKGNVRNARLLAEWIDHPQAVTRASRVKVALAILMLVIGIVGILALSMIVALKLARWLGL